MNKLFSPLNILGMTLSNRIVMSPMTRGHSPEGVPTDSVAKYYAARAKGGVALITTEAIAVNRPFASNNAGIPHFNTPQSREAWANVTKKVHDEGGLIFAQLWHCGEQQKPDPMFAAGLPYESPTNMTELDIVKTIEAFGDAAFHAQQAGFDGIELHGANGYLIDQFLWDRTNKRNDDWGGDLKRRARFAIEIIRAVKAKAGNNFPLSFRFSQFKLSDYSGKIADTPKMLEEILVPLADEGVDIFHASQRRFWEPEFAGSPLNLAGWAKKLTGKITTTVGSVGLSGPDTGDLLAHTGGSASVGGLEELVKRLENQEFDLVAVGRALLTDSQWANKVKTNQYDDLKGFDIQSLFSLVDA